jgi:hypothetical protein
VVDRCCMTPPLEPARTDPRQAKSPRFQQAFTTLSPRFPSPIGCVSPGPTAHSRAEPQLACHLGRSPQLRANPSCRTASDRVDEAVGDLDCVDHVDWVDGSHHVAKVRVAGSNRPYRICSWVSPVDVLAGTESSIVPPGRPMSRAKRDQGGNTAQLKAAGRKGGRATATSRLTPKRDARRLAIRSFTSGTPGTTTRRALRSGATRAAGRSVGTWVDVGLVGRRATWVPEGCGPRRRRG